jgi:hypothetical protein
VNTAPTQQARKADSQNTNINPLAFAVACGSGGFPPLLLGALRGANPARGVAENKSGKSSAGKMVFVDEVNRGRGAVKESVEVED